MKEKVKAITQDEWSVMQNGLISSEHTSGGGGGHRRYPPSSMITQIMLAALGFLLVELYGNIKESVAKLQTEVEQQGKSIESIKTSIEYLKGK